MRRFSSIIAVALTVASFVGIVKAQAPSPEPIWPAQFSATFGLYVLDVPSHSPILNATSKFLYNIDINAQLIQYPDRCASVLPGGDELPCQLLFNTQGIYITQPGLGVECCLVFPGVGPTPRNFTRGFAWNGTATAFDYTGVARKSDFYTSTVSVPGTDFNYWTEVGTHHDVLFRDGSGAFWAWDHLHPAPQAPSLFNLFADANTCNTACGAALELSEEDNTAMEQRAMSHGPIGLAMMHQRLAQQDQDAMMMEEARMIQLTQD